MLSGGRASYFLYASVFVCLLRLDCFHQVKKEETKGEKSPHHTAAASEGKGKFKEKKDKEKTKAKLDAEKAKIKEKHDAEKEHHDVQKVGNIKEKRDPVP